MDNIIIDKMECNIARDLLSMYAEGLTSKETNEQIELHLSQCRECNSIYNDMVSKLNDKNIQNKLVNENTDRSIARRGKIKVSKFISSIIILALIIFAIMYSKLFLVGSPTDDYVLESVEYDEESGIISISGLFIDSASVYSGYKLDEHDNTKNLVIYKSLSSAFNRSGNFEIMILKDKNESIRIKDITIDENGKKISKLANNLFDLRSAYLGDISNDARIAELLKVSEIGAFENELQTKSAPYKWTIRFKNFDEDKIGDVNYLMIRKAYMLLGLVENCDEISWIYECTNEDNTVSEIENNMITESVKDALGFDIKQKCKTVSGIQELINILELDK